MFKKIIPLITLNYVLIVNRVHAGLLKTGEGGTAELITQTTEMRTSAGYDSASTVGFLIKTIIQTFLGLLGVIFVGLIIYAGYNWMTSRGEEEKVRKAQQTIQRAVVGLIIIVSAYAITYFVFGQVDQTSTISTP